MSYGSVYEQIAHFRTSIDLAAHIRTTTQQSTQFLAQGVWHVHWVKEPCRFMNMARNEGSQKTKLDAALDRVKKLRRREPSPLPPLAALPLLSAVCTSRGPPAWNRTREPSACKIKGKMLIHPYLPSNGTMPPKKTSGLRVSKKSLGAGKGLWLTSVTRANSPGATTPPRRRRCDDLCSTSRRGWFMAREAYFLTCHSDLDGTLPIAAACRMSLRLAGQQGRGLTTAAMPLLALFPGLRSHRFPKRREL